MKDEVMVAPSNRREFLKLCASLVAIPSVALAVPTPETKPRSCQQFKDGKEISCICTTALHEFTFGSRGELKAISDCHKSKGKIYISYKDGGKEDIEIPLVKRNGPIYYYNEERTKVYEDEFVQINDYLDTIIVNHRRIKLYV